MKFEKCHPNKPYYPVYQRSKGKYTNGNVYKCIAQTTTVPTNTDYWKLLTSKGDKGDAGANGSMGATDVAGQGYLYGYYPSNSLTPPSAPTTNGAVPSGW
jgi:hypothetical protein